MKPSEQIIAIFPFSADPITFGHIDLIERASRLFGKVIAAVGIHPEKKIWLEPRVKVKLCKEALAHLSNVEVEGYTGLTVDFAFKKNADVLIRGVRIGSDLDYENSLFEANRKMGGGIETIYLPSKTEYSSISSSIVRTLVASYGDISHYVPLSVKKFIEEDKYSQFRLAVCGSIGTGKNYVCDILSKAFSEKKIPVTVIDCDLIVHNMYKDKDGFAIRLAEGLSSHFGDKVLESDGLADRKLVSQAIRESENPAKELTYVDQIFGDLILAEIRKQVSGRKGLILYNGALMNRKEWLTQTNGNTLFITVSKEVQLKRVAERDGLSLENAAKRIVMFGEISKKREELEGSSKIGAANIIEVNNDQPFEQESTESLVAKILKLFPGL